MVLINKCNGVSSKNRNGAPLKNSLAAAKKESKIFERKMTQITKQDAENAVMKVDFVGRIFVNMPNNQTVELGQMKRELSLKYKELKKAKETKAVKKQIKKYELSAFKIQNLTDAASSQVGILRRLILAIKDVFSRVFNSGFHELHKQYEKKAHEAFLASIDNMLIDDQDYDALKSGQSQEV